MNILKNSRKDGKGTYWFDIINKDKKIGFINAKGQIFTYISSNKLRLVGAI